MPAPDPALLERTDWRLLLPWPGGEPFSWLVLLGGPPGLAEALRETGVARQVETDGAGPAPAVGVLSGGPAALARGADALAPGGVLYGETGDLASARQAVEERGLEILGCAGSAGRSTPPGPCANACCGAPSLSWNGRRTAEPGS